MNRANPAVLVFALACLLAFSTALPSVFNQVASTDTESNIPRTLLGKPYRRRSDAQANPPSCSTLATPDHNNPEAYPDILPSPDHTGPHVPLPLPLVLNASPESVPARLRLIKLKRPLRYNPCSSDTPRSGLARPDGPTPMVEDARRVQSPMARPEAKTGSRDAPVRVGSPNRLYDKGEWKSRLLEEY